MRGLSMTLNEAKAKQKEAGQDSFDFLSNRLGPQHYRKTGREYLGASPSKKSLARLRQKVNGVLASDNPETWPEERDRLNRILRGWSNYFSYGTRWAAYGAVNHHVAVRVRHFLKRRQKVSTRGTRISPTECSLVRWACCACAPHLLRPVRESGGETCR